MVLGELNTSENRKRVLRWEIKTAVTTSDKGYTREADLQILRHVVGPSEYKQTDTLFYFVGTSSEIDTVPILEDALRRGKRVGVPRRIFREIMEICEIRSLQDLEAGKYDIMEPGAHAPVIQVEKINLAIVPCMSCSHGGRRLRCGGGYYDHCLGRTQVMKAAICREQIMCADIPVKPRDQMMDMVTSEKEVKRLVDQWNGAHLAGKSRLFHVMYHKPAESSL